MAAAQEAPGISGKDSAFYTWSFPGAPVRIHLYLDVVARLQKELAKAASVSHPRPRGSGRPIVGQGRLAPQPDR